MVEAILKVCSHSIHLMFDKVINGVEVGYYLIKSWLLSNRFDFGSLLRSATRLSADSSMKL